VTLASAFILLLSTKASNSANQLEEPNVLASR